MPTPVETDRAAQTRKLWAEAQLNSSRLIACPGPHDFVPHQVVGTFIRSYRCTRCDGVLYSDAYVWYARGLEHGKKTAQ